MTAADEALRAGDIAAYIAATADALSICQCVNSLPCSRVHQQNDETVRTALLRRLRSARRDPIGISADPDQGDVEHEVVGVLPEDVELIIRVLKHTNSLGVAS